MTAAMFIETKTATATTAVPIQRIAEALTATITTRVTRAVCSPGCLAGWVICSQDGAGKKTGEATVRIDRF
jgi:hypothetical protein